jgi:PPIC-type PPIASE domain
MRKSWLLCVLLGTLAWGQAAPSAAPPARPAPAPTGSQGTPQAPVPPVDKSASVPADAVVITVDGVCPPQPKPASAGTAAKTAAKPASAKSATANCKTVITKAQFEKLAGAVAPSVTPQLKKQLGSAMPRFIALSAEAKKEGIDKTDEYKEMLKFVQMQVLTNQLQRKIQKEAAEVPPAEVEKYYKDNPEAYAQYNFDRLFVQRTKQGDTEMKDEDEKDQKLTEEQQKAKEAAEKARADETEKAMTKVADDLRARAAKGEDFAKLQKEAFEAAGMKVDTPNVVLSNVRRTGLQAAHAAAFDLKPGEVSQVISDPGGHYIYKLNSTSQLPFDQAKNEIHSKLQNDRMREKMDKLNSSFTSELNPEYFGVGGSLPPHPQRPGMPPMPPMSQPQAAPPAQPQAAQPN